MQRHLVLVLALFAGLAFGAGSQPSKALPSGSSWSALQDFESLQAQARAEFGKQSFTLALRHLEQAAELDLSPAQREWLDYKLVDTRWRSLSASKNPDPSELDLAKTLLEAYLADFERPEDRNDYWAYAQESLGDYHWTRPASNNRGAAYGAYGQALEHWANSPDLGRARTRYLELVWRMIAPPGANNWAIRSHTNSVPESVLLGAQKIAQTSEDRARSNFYMALRGERQGSNERVHSRTRLAFLGALAEGKETSVYKDALYSYGVWLEERGTCNTDSKRGTWTTPDYVQALGIYRRLLEEYSRGSHEHWNDARNRVKKIVSEEVSVRVSQAYLPGSEIQFGLRWRNVPRIQLSLHPVSLTEAVDFEGSKRANQEYLSTIELAAHPAIQSWIHETGDEGLHLWGDDSLRPPQDLTPGAYVLQARAGAASSRELILISDGGLVVKSQRGGLLAWFADLQTGEPTSGAELVLWSRIEEHTPWSKQVATSDADGLANFDLPVDSSRRHQYFLSARRGERQAFSVTWEPWRNSPGRDWKIYATADRGAYRPGQEVSWKFSARVREDLKYSTPAGAKLLWELWGPTGELHTKAAVELNDFGSAWGSLTPEASWPLGEYTMRFYEARDGDDERGTYYGAGKLFRLEEYKRPEFLVTVERPRDDEGNPRNYRMGDMGEMKVSASYYFGGPVTSASVEVQVYRKPFYKRFVEPRQYPWFYAGNQSYRGWNSGPGDLVQSETSSIDESGELLVRFETSSGDSQDYEYTIQARVTDSSRREVSGSGRLRICHQGWFAKLDSEHNLRAPGQQARIELLTSDADDLPVSVEGEATLLRLVWREVWLNSAGERVEGHELRSLRALGQSFPPMAGAGLPPWRPIRAEYEEQALETIQLRTDELGKASWELKLPRSGHYLVRFAAVDTHGAAIQTELPLECLDAGTNEMGLHQSHARLLLDRDTFREGEPGLVMISTPASNRWVLFSIESEGLIEHRVVHLSGNVKLLRLEVTESWVPNVHLGLASFHGGQFAYDAHEVIVPPEKHFLDVELSLDPAVLPGSEGELEILVKDHLGRPVATEVGVSLVDASVDAIQAPYAIDPRQFFYGDKRMHAVTTSASSQARPHVRLLENEEGQLVDDRNAWSLDHGAQLPAGPGGQLKEEHLAALSALGYSGRESLDSISAGGPSVSRSRLASHAKRSAGEGSNDFFLGLGQLQDAFGATGEPRPEGEVLVQVRKDFRETALWLPELISDEQGVARATFKYPESLTRWKAVVRAQSSAADFGTVQGESATRLPLVARLQVPRFFVEGDECLVSLNVDNRTEADIEARPRLEIEGLEVLGFVRKDGQLAAAPEQVNVPAGEGLRLDWRVRAKTAGKARFIARVTSSEHSDGLERSVPIESHGILSHLIKAGRIDGDGVELSMSLPAARREGSTQLEVQVTPSLAVTMLDALPYLVDYPYGCTEQTLSRFVPTVVVKGTLEKLGLDPAQAMNRVYGGIESQFADRTQRETRGGLEILDQATEQGLARLYDFQHPDGSWSWWKHGQGDRFMTAYVVWGLSLARDAGVAVDSARLDSAAQWLGRELVSAKKQPELQAWMLHAHSAWLPDGAADQQGFAAAAFENLMQRRVALGAYGRALLALSAHAMKRHAEARVLADNLIDGVIRDDAPDASIIPLGTLSGGTQAPRAHWGEDGSGHRWSDGGVEATAFALRALVRIDPGHELVQPAAEWLVSNRRGAQWSNTKTTSIVVLALNDYLQGTGQLDRSISYAVMVNGTEVGRRELGPQEILAAPVGFQIPTELIRSGDNRVRVTRLSGTGPLYFSARASFFSLEEPIPPRGNEIFVRRQYFKLVPRPTLLRGTQHERKLMKSGDSIVSGERVEVVLTIETKNHLEYLMFEDLKPAGFEATSLKSGEPISVRELRSDEVDHRLQADQESRSGRGTRVHGEDFSLGYTGRQRQMHQEFRDRKVAFFLDQCPEGVWEIRYDLRAEAPGDFHALPLMAEAMYVPEIRANGAELRVRVLDREDL